MRIVRAVFATIICSPAVFAAASGVILYRITDSVGLIILGAVISFLTCVIPTVIYGKLGTPKLSKCRNGCMQLIIFCVSMVISIVFALVCIFGNFGYGFSGNGKLWVFHIVTAVLVEAVIFWNGMIRVYIFSEQLGIKWRVVGAICGMIPVVNLVVLGKIISVVLGEVSFENSKLLLDESRKDEQICKTKFPILMVHGIFFRDFKMLNYWGRIPKELEQNGAVIYYGNHQSAAPVELCAKELDARIRSIVNETGCEKVNVIAHSKGGLDMRYALSELGTDDFVASLTTINTPHRGCEFADYLLGVIPEKEKQGVAKAYNSVFRKLGDERPDFLQGVGDLTASACKKLNDSIHNSEKVYYQSVGSKQNVAGNGRFPLNYTYKLVKYFDGDNDGLVGEKSFPWGESFEYLTVKGKRGISHGDVIDLNRENIKGFDVREYYVGLVNKLAQMGF